MAGSKSHDLIAAHVEQKIIRDQHRANFALRDAGKGRLDLAFVSGTQDIERLPDGTRRRR